MSSTTAAVLVSLAAGLLLGVCIFLLIGQRRETVSERVSAYVKVRLDEHGEVGKSLIERALGDEQARKIARSPWITRMQLEMEVADLKIGRDQLAVLTLVGTIFVGWLLVISTGSLPACLLALFVPFAVQMAIKALAGRQRRAFADQLPDNLQVIASAMRAGTTFVGALQSVIQDAPEPSQRELRRAVRDEELGFPLGEALGQVTERMRSEDFQHVAIIASLQRETGGNTADVIDLVASTVRERMEIRRMVRGLTAQGRLSGTVLAMLPVGLLIMVSLIDPHYEHPLFHSTAGLVALGVACGLVILGGLAIRKIVNIEV